MDLAAQRRVGEVVGDERRADRAAEFLLYDDPDPDQDDDQDDLEPLDLTDSARTT